MNPSTRPASRILLLALLLAVPCSVSGYAQGEAAAKDEPKREVPKDPFPDAIEVPDGILDGGTEWLNCGKPIKLKDLKGKIVLLDFWTYCCINCIHVLPDLKFLEEKYEKELVVIGVHSAKFDNEKLSDNIRDAILRYEIKHPVVNDSEMIIWRKFGTRAWPTLALVDAEGRFIGRQGGEGNRELFDKVIGDLVKYHRAKGTLNEEPIKFDLEENGAKKTALKYPGKLLADEAGDRLFISDSNHNRIVVTDLNGKLRYTIGSGRIGTKDGNYASAEFDHPQGMALVGDTLYVADTENHLLRSVDLTTKQVTTLAGTGKQGRPGVVDGRLLATALNSPWDLLHVDGTLFIAMAGPHQIWSHELGSEKIGVHAGNAREDVINGKHDLSSFAQPSGLTLDGDGKSFYVADSEGSSIRKVPVLREGDVTTVAGTSELDRGQSLFAFGDVDAKGDEARFQHPLGVAWHKQAVYVADSYNHKIRRLDLKSGEVTTWLGNGKAGRSATQLSEPAGLSIANGQLYVADTNNHRICRINLESKELTELKLEGVTAPGKPKTRRVPTFKPEEVIAAQAVKTGDTMTIRVDLNIPFGFKVNKDAPLTQEVFLLEGDSIVGDAALKGRGAAKLEDGKAVIEVPLTGAGKAQLGVEVNFGYCDIAKGEVCRLGSGRWKFELTVSDDAESAEVQLKFPKHN